MIPLQGKTAFFEKRVIGEFIKARIKFSTKDHICTTDTEFWHFFMLGEPIRYIISMCVLLSSTGPDIDTPRFWALCSTNKISTMHWLLHNLLLYIISTVALLLYPHASFVLTYLISLRSCHAHELHNGFIGAQESNPPTQLQTWVRPFRSVYTSIHSWPVLYNNDNDGLEDDNDVTTTHPPIAQSRTKKNRMRWRKIQPTCQCSSGIFLAEEL